MKIASSLKLGRVMEAPLNPTVLGGDHLGPGEEGEGKESKTRTPRSPESKGHAAIQDGRLRTVTPFPSSCGSWASKAGFSYTTVGLGDPRALKIFIIAPKDWHRAWKIEGFI